jgi:imidazolonepropionase-like amidohydrolase
MKQSRLLSVIVSSVALSLAGARPISAQGPQAPPFRPGKPIAIVGGLLIDGTGAQPRWDQTVLMQGERILQIGPSDQVIPPADAEVIDASGMTVMPGLINSNQHIQLNPLFPSPTASLPLANIRARWEHAWSKEPNRAFWYLMQGITSMRNTSGPSAKLLPVKAAIDRGELPGPRIFLGGALLMSKEFFAAYTRSTPPDAVEWMRTQFAYAVIDDVDKDTDRFVGDDFHYWKLYMADDNWDGKNDFSDEQLRFIIDKAHKHGKIVDVHCTGNNEGLRRMLAFDIDTLEHPFYGSALIPTDIVEGYARKHVIAATLLNVMIVGAQRAMDPHRFDESIYAMSMEPDEYRILMGYRDRMLANMRNAAESGVPIYDPTRPGDFPDERLQRAGPERRSASFNQQQTAMQISKENMRRFIKAGVRFSTGTDTNSFLNFMQEDPMANEMISMVELGMPPLDVIVASTKNGAETVGLAKTVGTIEAGKLADVIVVAGNPLQDMRAMKRVAYVVKGGVRFK